MRELVIADNMIALARGHKSKGKHTAAVKSGAQKRSAMLRMIMPFLSRELGEKLAIAIDQKSPAKFAALWEQVKKQIVAKLETSKPKHHKATAASIKVDIPDDMLVTVLKMVCERMCENKDPCPLEPQCAEGPATEAAPRFVNVRDLYERLVANSVGFGES